MSWLSAMLISAAPLLLKGRVSQETLDWVTLKLPDAIRQAEAYKGHSPAEAMRSVIQKTGLTSSQVEDMLRLSESSTVKALLSKVAPKGFEDVVTEMKRAARPAGETLKRAGDFPRLKR